MPRSRKKQQKQPGNAQTRQATQSEPAGDAQKHEPFPARASHPSSEEIRERGGLHAFDPATQVANADRPDGNMRDDLRAGRTRAAQSGEDITGQDIGTQDIGDSSGIELGGHRSMRPDSQAGIDQGAERGSWRGEGWDQDSPTREKIADRVKPGDSRYKKGNKERKFGT